MEGVVRVTPGRIDNKLMGIVQIIQVTMMPCITIHIQIPGPVGKSTVAITKGNNFFIFTIKKSKNFIKLMQSF